MTSLRIAVLALIVPFALSAQAASLRGRILTDSTERPIPGVVVAISDLKIQATSDSLGNFVLPGIKAGAYIVSAKKIGFGALATRVRFGARDAVEADFLMTPNVQALPDVNIETKAPVRALLQEFEARRTAGAGGRFLTQADIDKRAYSTTSDILRTSLPGAELRRSGREVYVIGGRMQLQAGALTLGGNAPGDCPAAIVLDGIFVFQGNQGERPFDINSLPPAMIAGIEYYASAASMPAKYNGTRGTCGLMLIWTR
jgi:hypothetical protein